MKPELLNTLLTISLPIIGAGIGFFIKHIIEKKKDLYSQVTIERRELYQHFVNLIIDLFSASKTGKSQPDRQVLNKLYEFYKKYVLYASPGVINAFSDYFQYLYLVNADDEKSDIIMHFRKLSKIMVEMRKDLGLSNKKLGTDGEKLFRALITDFDKYIK